jgi:hypothetical protein
MIRHKWKLYSQRCRIMPLISVLFQYSSQLLCLCKINRNSKIVGRSRVRDPTSWMIFVNLPNGKYRLLGPLTRGKLYFLYVDDGITSQETCILGSTACYGHRFTFTVCGSGEFECQGLRKLYSRIPWFINIILTSSALLLYFHSVKARPCLTHIQPAARLVTWYTRISRTKPGYTMARTVLHWKVRNIYTHSNNKQTNSVALSPRANYTDTFRDEKSFLPILLQFRELFVPKGKEIRKNVYSSATIGHVKSAVSCGSCKKRRFGGMCCLHNQGGNHHWARNNVSSNKQLNPPVLQKSHG